MDYTPGVGMTLTTVVTVTEWILSIYWDASNRLLHMLHFAGFDIDSTRTRLSARDPSTLAEVYGSAEFTTQQNCYRHVSGSLVGDGGSSFIVVSSAQGGADGVSFIGEEVYVHRVTAAAAAYSAGPTREANVPLLPVVTTVTVGVSSSGIWTPGGAVILASGPAISNPSTANLYAIGRSGPDSYDAAWTPVLLGVPQAGLGGISISRMDTGVARFAWIQARRTTGINRIDLIETAIAP
jgi:hypothetical protein